MYYARAIESTILPALNDIGTQQAKPTDNTKKEADWLLDFLHTHPNAKLRFFAGTMQLAAESDAAYLVQPGAKSRYAGIFYLESKPHPINYNQAPSNAPIHIECRTLKNVVCSAAEAECGGLFHNGQKAVQIARILEALGHQQNPIKLKTDNKTAESFVHTTMRTKRSKSWDKNYHWLRQEDLNKILKILWDKGVNNKADYFTKHHSPSHHKAMRPQYILKGYAMTAN